MNLPAGRLVRSRVVTDPGEALRSALDRQLTGYAVLEPQDALLLDGDDAGLLVFEDGVPVAVYDTGTGRGGPAALADLAMPGPYRLELRSLAPERLPDLDDRPDLRVPPAMPAKRLAGDADLADRTSAAAPTRSGAETDPQPSPERSGDTTDEDHAVAAFLEDEAKIDALRQQAREQAQARAEEWGLADQLE